MPPVKWECGRPKLTKLTVTGLPKRRRRMAHRVIGLPKRRRRDGPQSDRATKTTPPDGPQKFRLRPPREKIVLFPTALICCGSLHIYNDNIFRSVIFISLRLLWMWQLCSKWPMDWQKDMDWQMTFPFVDSPPENAQYFTIHKEKTATFKTICQGEDEESLNCHQAEASTKKSSKTEILVILPKSWTREKMLRNLVPLITRPDG